MAVGRPDGTDMPLGTVTRILAIRHGETAWNVDTRVQGHLDIPLNETGRWQAHRLALAVAEEGIDAIYASDDLYNRPLEIMGSVRAKAQDLAKFLIWATSLKGRGPRGR